MATITVVTTPEEQEKVLEALKPLQGKTVSMPKIAAASGLSASRTRYAIADLVEAGRVLKIPTKAINPKYIRYMYKIV